MPYDRVSSSVGGGVGRSEEHTSELQSLRHLVCRLLLEKKTRSQGRKAAAAPRAPAILRDRMRRRRAADRSHEAVRKAQDTGVAVAGAQEIFFFLMIGGPPKSPLFPYTPLSR